jgi:acyl-CoA synthetase (AMP-forming)/AMP-acid ligase II
MAIVSGPALPSPAAMTWIGDYARRGAREAADRLAFVVPDLGVSLSYGELDRRVDRACALLRERGLREGDRLAYYGRNNEQYFIVLLAAIRCGLVLVPLNWRCVEPEIAFFLEDSGARLLICDEAFLSIARAACARFEPSPPIVLTEGAGGLRELLSDERASHDEAVPWTEDAVCLHLYTSGTTGKPKGVLSRHHGLSIARFQEYTWADFPNWHGGTIVSAMPNFHIGGMSWVLMGLLRLSTIVLTGDASAPNLVRLLVQHKAERTFAVPTVVRAMVDEVRAAGVKMPWLDTIFYGAAPMSTALLADAIEILGCRFGQYFGMTEITGTATFLGPGDHDLANPRLLGSVGRPYPGIDLEIRDAEAQPVARGAHGEIWIRSPTVMQGYWHRPDATAEVMKNGWYRTGDGGYHDEQGFLFLTDRIKDLIVSGGENVYPGEVEEALRRFATVYEVAVVGVPHERWGEAVAAVVESRPGQQVDVDALIEFARTQVAPYKCPKRVLVVDTLPRTASGKIQRGAARKLLLDSIREKS